MRIESTPLEHECPKDIDDSFVKELLLEHRKDQLIIRMDEEFSVFTVSHGLTTEVMLDYLMLISKGRKNRAEKVIGWYRHIKARKVATIRRIRQAKTKKQAKIQFKKMEWLVPPFKI